MDTRQTAYFEGRMDGGREPGIAGGLLEYLKRATNTAVLGYAEQPRLIGEGFEASVFGFRLENAPDWASGRLVLRLLRGSIDGPAQQRNSVVHNTLAELGYPTPRVLIVEPDTEILGSAFFIARRLPGQKLDQVLDERTGASGVAQTLVAALDLRRRVLDIWSETQIRLHALPSEVLARSLEAVDLSPDDLSFGAKLAGMENLIAADGLIGLEPGLAWLRARRPAEPRQLAVCHGDLTPSNILVEGSSVSGVLDWSSVSIADPALDVGAALVRIATLPVQAPALLKPFVGLCRSEFARAYARAYSRARPIDRVVVRYYCVFNCLQQLTWLGHLVRLGDPIFGARSVFAIAPRATAYVRALADVTVDLPSTGPTSAAKRAHDLRGSGRPADGPAIPGDNSLVERRIP